MKGFKLIPLRNFVPSETAALPRRGSGTEENSLIYNWVKSIPRALRLIQWTCPLEEHFTFSKVFVLRSGAGFVSAITRAPDIWLQREYLMLRGYTVVKLAPSGFERFWSVPCIFGIAEPEPDKMAPVMSNTVSLDIQNQQRRRRRRRRRKVHKLTVARRCL